MALDVLVWGKKCLALSSLLFGNFIYYSYIQYIYRDIDYILNLYPYKIIYIYIITYIVVVGIHMTPQMILSFICPSHIPSLIPISSLSPFGPPILVSSVSCSTLTIYYISLVQAILSPLVHYSIHNFCDYRCEILPIENISYHSYKTEYKIYL